VVNVLQEGATGSGQQLGNGKSNSVAITAGQAVLYASQAAFTPADVGKKAWVAGAGAAGAALLTTITGYYSATQVVLGTVASTTVSGAEFVWWFDDTAAISAAISGAAPGSVIYFPAPSGAEDGDGGGGNYMISAAIPLQANCAYLGPGDANNGLTMIRQAPGTNLTSASKIGLFVANAWATNATVCDGPVFLRGLGFDPDWNGYTVNGYAGSNTGNCAGVILTNFWSRLSECYFQNCGGAAAAYTDLTANGSNVVTNSCSENQFYDNKVTNGIYGFFAESQNGASNQDGFCDRNLISGQQTAAIYIGRAAGWKIRGNHMYSMGGDGIDCYECYATWIMDNYLEDFGALNVANHYYSGIQAELIAGRRTFIFNNDVSCNEPSTNTSHYLYYNVGTNGTGAQHVNMGGNHAGCNVTPTTQGVAYNFNNPSASLVVFDSGGNDPDNVETAYNASSGVTYTSKNLGLVSARGGLQSGNGTATGATVWSGSGAPNITASVTGDIYFRTDATGTANERIYIATAANTWTGIV